MKKSIVKKSNDLNEAQYSFSIWETRVFIKLLSMIGMNDNEFKEYIIDIGDFIKEINVDKNKNSYKLIKKAAESLLQKIVVIDRKLEDGTIERLKTPIVIGVKHNLDTHSYLKMSFHPDLKRDLLELKNKFLIYDAKNVLSLSTPFSIRIYELSKQYEKIGKRIMTVDEFRAFLKIEDKYPNHYHLRTKIIEPSISHINENTDINLTYSEIKRGRKVIKIQFDILSKEKAVVDEVYKTLKALGVKESSIKSWREKYDDLHIMKRIEYMKAKDSGEGRVENQAGYLSSIMNVDIEKLQKEKTAQESPADITSKVNAILYSRPDVQHKITAKYGEVSQKAMNAIVKKMFPEKFS